MTAFWVLLALISGFLVGWAAAHHMVAAECERLGSFFVDEKTYHCHLITRKGDKP